MNSYEIASSILAIVGLLSIIYIVCKQVRFITTDCKPLMDDKPEYYSKYLNNTTNLLDNKLSKGALTKRVRQKGTNKNETD